MKNTIFIFIAVFLTALSLSACVKNQNTNANGLTISTPPPDDQSMNDTDYQEMMEEETERADMAREAGDASFAHGGGGGHR